MRGWLGRMGLLGFGVAAAPTLQPGLAGIKQGERTPFWSVA
jgi:hypothetical protein